MKRYGFPISPGLGEGLFEETDGEWVRHSDAEAEVEKWKRVAVVMAEYLVDRRELRWDNELLNAVDAARASAGEE